MSWLKKLFGPKEVQEQKNEAPVVVKVVEQVVVKPSNVPNIRDYPKEEYSAYWEMQIKKDGVGELRFYPYKGTGLLDHSSYPGASEEEVKEKMYRAIRSKMDKFKVQ